MIKKNTPKLLLLFYHVSPIIFRQSYQRPITCTGFQLLDSVKLFSVVLLNLKEMVGLFSSVENHIMLLVCNLD